MKVRTLFFGSGSFAIEILKALNELEFVDLVGIVTQPDKPFGRNKELKATELGEYVQSHLSHIEVFKPEKIRSEGDGILNKTKPELIIVAAYGQIIPNSVLEYPEYKCLNLHGSILPELRGAVPVQMAILSGLSETGVTLQVMSEKMDEGNIIKSSKIEIRSSKNSETLMNELSFLGAKILKDALLDYIEGRITPVPQDHSKATYCYKEDLSKEKAEITGGTTIEQAERMVRAFYPWPLAWFKNKEGKIIQIHSAKISDLESNFDPFTVFRKGKTLYLQLKDGNLELEEVKIEGKPAMKSPEYLFMSESTLI